MNRDSFYLTDLCDICCSCGTSFGTYYAPGAPKKDGTTLIELQIEHIGDAHDIVGVRPEGVYTPLVLHPLKSICGCFPFCCCCFVSVPHGFSAIVTKFGAIVPGDEKDKTWSSGFHWFSPLNCVDKLVSKQIVIFDTPVKEVKTRDNINVNIDVMIAFEITRAPDFVYSIGPEKFDDLLRASQDEQLRQLAYQTEVAKIYDLHGAQTGDIVAALNEKFKEYGVDIHSFTIKSVQIPHKMASQFENKTLLDTETTRRHKEEDQKHQQLNFTQGAKKLDYTCQNMKMEAQETAERVKQEKIRETSEVIAKTQKDLAELEVAQKAIRDQNCTDAELAITKLRAEILQIERELHAKTASECGQLETKSQAEAKDIQAEARVKVAEHISNGQKKMGEAEGIAAESFIAMRGHEADLSRLAILEKVCRNQNLVVATTQENTMGLSEENKVVTQVTQQGLEAMRAKLAEITATSLSKLEVRGHK